MLVIRHTNHRERTRDLSSAMRLKGDAGSRAREWMVGSARVAMAASPPANNEPKADTHTAPTIHPTVLPGPVIPTGGKYHGGCDAKGRNSRPTLTDKLKCPTQRNHRQRTRLPRRTRPTSGRRSAQGRRAAERTVRGRHGAAMQQRRPHASQGHPPGEHAHAAGARRSRHGRRRHQAPRTRGWGRRSDGPPDRAARATTRARIGDRNEPDGRAGDRAAREGLARRADPAAREADRVERRRAPRDVVRMGARERGSRGFHVPSSARTTGA